MTTSSKVTFRGQQKAIVAESWVQSDEMSPDEVLALSKDLFFKANKVAESETLKYRS